MDKVKVFEMFSGFGGASFALKRTDIPHQIVGYSEIDKYAIKTYNHNHPNIKNYGDATKIDPKKLPDFDLLTGGFPCQAFSIAGARKGFEDTRGTLIYDILRIAAEKKPKYMLLENVKGLLSHEDGRTFATIRHAITKLGYGVLFEVLNSKDYGTPQNRERIWIVCKLGGWDFMEFSFPRKEPLTVFLKDLLDKEVAQKYYLSSSAVKRLTNNNEGFHSKVNPDVGSCLFASQHKIARGMDLIKEDRMICLDEYGNEVPNTPETGQAERIYSSDGISPALNVGWVPKTQLAIKTATEQGWEFAEEGDGLSLDYPDSETRRGRVQKQISPTLQTDDTKGVVLNNLQIRKLTPTECFRLMGFKDGEITFPEDISDSQKYKMAGNGWELNVVTKILHKLLI